MHRHHAQASLQKTQLTYAAILASITESVVVTDTVGAVRFMNLSAEEFLGRHIVETLGEHADKVLNLFDETGTAPAPLRQALQHSDERVTGKRHVLVHPDGRKSDIVLTLTPIPAPGGKSLGTAILIRDRTGRQCRA
jgi:PAS domain S-box-containing protein